MRIAALGAFTALLIVGPASRADADTPATVPLEVRTYDQTELTPDVREAMLRVAATILAGAGVSVDWRACDAGRAAAPCPAPLGPRELALRLVRRAPEVDSARTVTLGYALVNTTDGSGALATVYVDRASQLARRADLELSTLLGRAVAHEIGHLLLGTSAHSRDGVMRASWSPRALLRNQAGDWAFTAREAKLLRKAVAGRP